MINFNSKRGKLYCKIIHNYLEVEIFSYETDDMGDIIENYMPKYLFREQYTKCVKVFNDLYQWTNDPFLHELDAFHELALYNFLVNMNDIKNDDEERFNDVYYDNVLKKDIVDSCKEEIKEFYATDDITIDDLIEDYYSPFNICDDIFEDTDFLELPYLYNERKVNMPVIAERLGIELDYYFDILPLDIQEKYKSNHITLTGEVGDFFNYLQKRINSGSLSDLFWENGTQINEKKIHTIMENIMDAYFIGKGVDISREVLIKNGQVDFKLFRNDNKDEKILIEVKKASSSYLKAGYEKQLCNYIEYSNCDNAFYFIVCFTDNDYKIAENFIRNHVYTDTYQMYINISILDVRKKIAPSKKK